MRVRVSSAARLRRAVLVAVFATGVASAAPTPDTFTGTVTDDACARGGHAQMRMGPTDAECTRLCVMIHGSAYVLEDGANVYVLSDQKLAEEFAAQKVRVVGTLDAKAGTIAVESISAAR